MASRSISIVYDLSGESERQDMLKALFDTLMNGKKYIFCLVEVVTVGLIASSSDPETCQVIQSSFRREHWGKLQMGVCSYYAHKFLF